MEFAVNDVLQVDGDMYSVIGKILYRNLDDNCRWYEYRIRHLESSTERWLSYDDVYNEYSLSRVVGSVSKSGYHEVDRGTEEVLGAWGKVDVEVGDTAAFCEYEDSTEEKIISSEVWDDGEELSVGYYLDWDEVSLCRNPDGTSVKGVPGSGSEVKRIKNILTVAAVLILALPMLSGLLSSLGELGGKSIASYLKKNEAVYTYVTSITGNGKQKADVYRSAYDLDTTVKNIINGVEGQTESVQQNTEDGDNSVAILTKKDYCLVYESEEQEVLVQVSSRKYAYTTDKTPYHARSHTHHFYRSYYYSRGYRRDRDLYRSSPSPYEQFTDQGVTINSSDPYNSYSSSVRQSSINSRTSSGGGLSSGK